MEWFVLSDFAEIGFLFHDYIHPKWGQKCYKTSTSLERFPGKFQQSPVTFTLWKVSVWLENETYCLFMWSLGIWLVVFFFVGSPSLGFCFRRRSSSGCYVFWLYFTTMYSSLSMNFRDDKKKVSKLQSKCVCTRITVLYYLPEIDKSNILTPPRILLFSPTFLLSWRHHLHCITPLFRCPLFLPASWVGFCFSF